ncbi:MAG: SLC13 family permease [Clostridiales bacterium]|nr:SLC13 family permease [Clostridiales bacterium]
MLLTLLTLALAAIGFIWGKIRADVVALIALMVLVVGDVITTTEALSGFSNSIVIMMIGLFVVGGAIFNTGLAKIIGSRLLKLGGGSETRLFIVVVAGTALIGGFVSNTGTVALMLPIVVSMLASIGGSPRRLLMPIAFASSLGGMLTLIGTPPNLVIAEAWETYAQEQLSFFALFPAGIICLVIGIVLMFFMSRMLVRKEEKDSGNKGPNRSLQDIISEYGINADLYRIVVARGATIAGHTVASLDLRSRYGLDILEIRSERQKGLLKNVTQKTARASTKINIGDVMYVKGSREEIGRFVVDCHLQLDASGEVGDTKLQFYDIGIAELVPMPSSPILKGTIAELDFGNKYGVNIIGIRRKNQYITNDLGSQKVQTSDVLLVQGSWKAIEKVSYETQNWVVLGRPLSEASKVTLDYKAPMAASIMVLMITGMLLEVLPPVIVVIIAALAMVLTGCFRNVNEAYKTINWESVVLIAAMMPMSFALEKTGVSEAVSSGLVNALGGLGPHFILAGIFFTTSVMTLFISNTATAVLMAPIALESAMMCDVSPLPFLVAVTFGASLCFASPFSTPPNALVMSAGQYTFMDYVKVGLPLQLLLGIVMILILPLLFPFG